MPLGKFNLNRVKPDYKKIEDEEKWLYCFIPRTLFNRLQAFTLLVRVIGEKAPKHCLALFCYMDSSGKAHRNYMGEGVVWLRYDKQFRQKKTVHPSLRWDKEDISMWMQLMAVLRGRSQSFPGASGCSYTGGPRPVPVRGVAGSLMRGIAALPLTVAISTGVQDVVEPIVFHNVFERGREKLPMLWRKGEKPARVSEMLPNLVMYPHKLAAQLVQGGGVVLTVFMS